VEARVGRDADALLWAAGVLPPGHGRKTGALVEQYTTALLRELDMVREARTMRLARRLLEDSGLGVVVPQEFVSSASGVLVMEFVESVPVSRAPDKLGTATTIMHACLYQILRGGPFTCDPHEGNLGTTASGDVVVYDFGNSCYLSSSMADVVFEVSPSFHLRDAAGVLGVLRRNGLVEAGTPEEMRHMETLIEETFRYIRTMDIAEFTPRLFETGAALLSRDLYTVMRTVMMTEGVCKGLTPEFSLEACIDRFVEMYAAEFVARKGARDARGALGALRALGGAMGGAPPRRKSPSP
jgi:predicted unusual protein kinase regulating ubiquinone biosynthesis (AarF/ABC1/UbiB family)